MVISIGATPHSQEPIALQSSNSTLIKVFRAMFDLRQMVDLDFSLSPLANSVGEGTFKLAGAFDLLVKLKNLLPYTNVS